MKVYCQSDSRSKAMRQHGCGPYAALSGLHVMSGGEWGPRNETAAAQYRLKKAGTTDADFKRRGTTSTELAASMHAVVATEHRMDIQVQLRRGTHVMGQLVPFMIAHDAGALVAVDYGVVVDAGEGKGTYRGGHWVFVFEPDMADDEITVADPLRHATTRWPLPLLVDAMEHFGKRPWLHGRGEAIILGRWLTWRQGFSIVKKQRDDCREGNP